MLTKTNFLQYLEAPMHLWAVAHDQIEKKTLTPFERHLVAQGQQVEALAQGYLESVLLPKYSRAQLFWQSSYDDGRFMSRTDALIFDQDEKMYDLYEIKSATSVKTLHGYDLAFQVLLLETLLDLRSAHIIHIDKNYNHQHPLDLDQFFTIQEMSGKVEQHREDIQVLREEAWAVTQLDRPQPSFACTKPQSCPCPALCHPDLPEYPIYNLPRIGKKAAQLRQMGITAIENIPGSYKLSPSQKKHYETVKTGRPMINRQAIKQSLETLEYPIYFLDYETFNPAVPLFKGYRPYEHIVFQYSLHVLESPGAKPSHYECLLTEDTDPAPLFVPHLLRNLGPVGSVVVWSQGFERQRNQELAAHCPEYAGQLSGINARLYDLMLIFKKDLYVHPDFKGSASLKAVLPVVCPNLTYDRLAINDGTQAMLAWQRLQQSNLDPNERAKIEADMREYCELDTFGMVAIWQTLQER
jgi:hypothetical protein